MASSCAGVKTSVMVSKPLPPLYWTSFENGPCVHAVTTVSLAEPEPRKTLVLLRFQPARLTLSEEKSLKLSDRLLKNTVVDTTAPPASVPLSSIVKVKFRSKSPGGISQRTLLPLT